MVKWLKQSTSKKKFIVQSRLSRARVRNTFYIVQTFLDNIVQKLSPKKIGNTLISPSRADRRLLSSATSGVSLHQCWRPVRYLSVVCHKLQSVTVHCFKLLYLTRLKLNLLNYNARGNKCFLWWKIKQKERKMLYLLITSTTSAHRHRFHILLLVLPLSLLSLP